MRHSEILIENLQSETTPPLFGTLVGGDPLEFHLDFWHQQTRVPALSDDVVCMILGLAVLVVYRLMTDTRTGNDSKYRASIGSRG